MGHSRIKYLFVIIKLTIISYSSTAQGIKGVILDTQKEPVPFATIYVQSLKTGTSANLNGVYQLSLEPGSYKLEFRAVGYKPLIRQVIIQQGFLNLPVTLETEVYQLKGITITPGGEDIANRIMRKVIALAPYHLNQVLHFTSQVYLKGTIVFEKIPRILAKRMVVSTNGKEFKVKSGDVFVEESVNELSYNAPNSYTQKVKSMKSSLPEGTGQPVTPIELIKSSFYKPEVFEDLPACISPLSPNAFAHYKFEYKGMSQEGDVTIDKIKVIPNRESQQLFSGFIYIAEGAWCIHSLTLSNEQFWGKLQISQVYAPVQGNAWLPISYAFLFDASYLGIIGRFKYNSSVKYTSIKINEKVAGSVDEKIRDKQAGVNHPANVIQKFDNTLLAKDDVNKKEMRQLNKQLREQEQKATRDTARSLELMPAIKTVVEPGSENRDTAYWHDMRTIPLTAEELQSYHRTDSIIGFNNGTLQNDSIRKHRHKNVVLVSKLFGLYSWYNNDSTIRYRYNGLIKPKYLSFNTVDGWAYQQSFNIFWQIDSMHKLTTTTKLSYAFNRQKLMGYVSENYNYAPKRRGKCVITVGSGSFDFNVNSGISPHVNSLSSLFFRRNYEKLFEKKYLIVDNRIDLANGLEWGFSTQFFKSTQLINHSDYSFFYRNERDYTNNIPDNDFSRQDSAGYYTGLSISTGLSYTPEYFYRISQLRKVMVRSKYPTFSIQFSAGIPRLLGSESSYTQIVIGIRQSIPFRNEQHLKYQVEFGTFPTVNKIHFSEFRHFNTQSLPIMVNGFSNSFQLLDFYQYSLTSQYAEGHVMFDSPLILIKRLPVFSNRLWNEGLYINYLSTSRLKHHMEAGYGITGVLGMLDIGIFTSFENFVYRSVGLKLNIGLKD